MCADLTQFIGHHYDLRHEGKNEFRFDTAKETYRLETSGDGVMIRFYFGKGYGLWSIKPDDLLTVYISESSVCAEYPYDHYISQTLEFGFKTYERLEEIMMLILPKNEPAPSFDEVSSKLQALDGSVKICRANRKRYEPDHERFWIRYDFNPIYS